MAENTKIQWCDETCNPGMGCNGCELWPNISKIRSTWVALALEHHPATRTEVAKIISSLIAPFESATHIWHGQKALTNQLAFHFPGTPIVRWADSLRALFRCYAGIQHLKRGASPDDWTTARIRGFAPIFDQPQEFPGRMIKAAKKRDLRGIHRPSKPWLDGLPRLVFVSDMGDVLSGNFSSEYLKREIVDIAMSPHGCRHIWLWLTKRPERMAEFAVWLEEQHEIEWPDNLVAMTSVTNRATRSRINELRKVPAKLRGLSVEPLLESVDLDLAGIDWCIVGGESGEFARKFDIEWARSLREQCSTAGAAFFVKQLGAHVVEDDFPLLLTDSHGGDHSEWPDDLRVRELPQAFRSITNHTR